MSTEVKPTDWDAEDNMWEPTPSGGGGGSSLPPYSSADIGKVLTVGEDAEHSVSETIIDEQTFTTDGTSSAKATLTVDFTYEQASVYASEETDVIVVLDGNNIPTKFEWGVYGELNRPMIYITDTAFIVWNGIVVQARQLSKNTTYTISVIRSIPAVEPKWEAVEGGVPNVDIERTAGGIKLLTPFADLQEYVDKYGSVNLRAIVNGVVVTVFSASLRATQDKSTIYVDAIKGMGIFTNPDSIHIDYMEFSFTSSTAQIIGQAMATIDATVMS